MKRWLLSKVITPTRVRKIVAGAVSWLICTAIERGSWDAVLSVARWMRRFADFIERWTAAELPKDKDQAISDLVSEAITDEAVDRLVDRVAAMRAEQLELEAPAAVQAEG